MSKAYIATGERAMMVIAYDKDAPTAMKKVAKKSVAKKRVRRALASK